MVRFYTVKSRNSYSGVEVYYIAMRDENGDVCARDSDLAYKIGITSWDYIEGLRKLGASSKMFDNVVGVTDNELYFETKEMAQRAIDEYIEPAYIMKKLVN